MGKRAATKAEKAHMDAVASLGCLICKRPAAIHHARNRTGRRRDHMRVIPLCPAHHQHDKLSAHGMYHDRFFELYGDEVSMLEQVEQQLGRRDNGYL